jgi:NADPH-dependent curcumin reductase CurA
VGQIARIKGCRVVGIAGGEEKGAWLTGELGFDAAVDYRSPEFKRQLRAACPEGIDVYFDNTGGDIFEACLFAMKTHGRIACCGALSVYDGAAPPHGPRGVPGLIVTKRLTLRGFIVSDFAAQNDKALADLQGWVASGELKVHEDIIDGFENLPAALIGLLHGDNRGKRMVRV